MIDWDLIEERRPTINVTVRDSETKDVLATVNGLAVDAKICFLMECVCRESGLPARPSIFWDGKAVLPWETVEEVGIPDGAEIPCICQQALVTASHDGLAKIWNMDTGESEMTLTGHNGKVLDARFSPNGRLVATCSEDHTAKVWSTLTGKCERTLSHADIVYSVAFSHDGKLVTTASEDRTAKVWVVKTGECKQTLRGHTAAVYCSAFTKTHGQVMTESRDGTVKLWNPKTGVCDRTLEEQAEVYSASYSTDGRYLATTPGDNTALILNVDTGDCELTLVGHEDLVISARYCPKRPKPEALKAKKASALPWANTKDSRDSSGTADEN